MKLRASSKECSSTFTWKISTTLVLWLLRRLPRLLLHPHLLWTWPAWPSGLPMARQDSVDIEENLGQVSLLSHHSGYKKQSLLFLKYLPDASKWFGTSLNDRDFNVFSDQADLQVLCTHWQIYISCLLEAFWTHLHNCLILESSTILG